MFELWFANSTSIFRSTRLLARQILRLVKKEDRNRYEEQLQRLFELEKTSMNKYERDAVAEEFGKILDALTEGEGIDLKLEYRISLFLFRTLELADENIDQYEKLKNKLHSTPNIQQSTKQKINELFNELVREHQAILQRVKADAVTLKDQNYGGEKLRDMVFNTLLKDTREKMSARRLRKIFTEEKSITSKETRILGHLRKLHIDEVSADEIDKMIDELLRDIKQEESVLKSLFDATEFLLKLAVQLYFKLSADEKAMTTLIAQLKTMKYPEEKLEEWTKKAELLDKKNHKTTLRNQNLLFQILQGEEKATKQLT